MRKIALFLLVLVPVVGLAAAAPLLLGHAMFALGFKNEAARFMGDPGWKGYALARDGDYLSAVKAFGEAPANAYDKATALAHAGLYRQALDAFDTALDADPEDADARFNKAIVAKLLDAEATPRGEANGNANASSRSERHHGGSGDQEGDTNSVGIGFVGNKEGSSNSGPQGGSKVSKIGKGQTSDSGNDTEKASGSAGQSGGKGRSGGDLADITEQLAANQRRYSPVFTSKTIRANTEWLQTVPDDPGQYLKLQIRAEHKRREALAARAAGDD